MQYEIKYKYEGVIATYYMPLETEYELFKQDISYSARIAVAKLLGTSLFEIISVRRIV